jgi:hypothetical protein
MPAKKEPSDKPVSDTFHYPHVAPQIKNRLVSETYEYDMPFKYGNIKVVRWFIPGREGHGVELGVINAEPQEGLRDPVPHEADNILIEEQNPIIRVAVIGSACTPPGYVQLECEPIPEWRKAWESPSALPVRFRAENLWGMHLRVDALLTGTPDVQPKFGPPAGLAYEKMPEAIKALYPSTRENPWHTKSHSCENPLAGMSCAVFEIPPSRRVRVSGGSISTGWTSDNFPTDNHYSFRTIRTTVLLRREEVSE